MMPLTACTVFPDVYKRQGLYDVDNIIAKPTLTRGADNYVDVTEYVKSPVSYTHLLIMNTIRDPWSICSRTMSWIFRSFGLR